MLFPTFCCCRARSLSKTVQDSLCKDYNLGLDIFSQNPQHSGVHRETWRRTGFCASHYSLYASQIPIQLEIYAKRKLRLDSKLKTLTTSRHNTSAVALGTTSEIPLMHSKWALCKPVASLLPSVSPRHHTENLWLYSSELELKSEWLKWKIQQTQRKQEPVKCAEKQNNRDRLW